MGMRHINFDLDLQFDTPTTQWLSEQILLFNMMVLAARNYHYLKANPNTVKLYDDPNVTYLVPEQLDKKPSDTQLAAMRKFLSTQMGMTNDEIQHHIDLAKGVEIFRDIPRIREHGGGDCDNLACWRAAELSVAGCDARPRMTCRQQDGRTIYHAIVLHVSDGSSEDPSLIKGMGGSARAAERFEECRKNYERNQNLLEEGKQIVLSSGLSGVARDDLIDRIQMKIDSFGYLPKDGVFRVGQPTGIAIAKQLPAKKKKWWQFGTRSTA